MPVSRIAFFGYGSGFGFGLILAAVLSVNLGVDAEALFGKHVATYEKLVQNLLESEHGIVLREGNVRWAKLTLIRRSPTDCYINGSSHTMEFSFGNWPAAADYGCEGLTNIGVYYSVFEDSVIQLAALLDSAEFETLFLAMDPWIFRKNKSRRYEVMPSVHRDSRRALGLPEDRESYGAPLSRIAHLSETLNFSYFIRNVRALFRFETENRTPGIVEAVRLDQGHTGKGPPDSEIFLRDGSRIRGKGSYEKLVGRGRYFDAGNVKPPFVVEDVVEEFRILLARAKRSGKRVAFVLTPYSPEVWQCRGDNERTCRGLREVEPVIRALAAEFGIDVFGSYDPVRAGFTSDDFLDGHHLAPDSFRRLGLTYRAP